MFTIEKLQSPEEVKTPGGSVTLTHIARCLKVDPRDPVASASVHVMKGFINEELGLFQDFGPHENHTLDAQGYADMLADTTGGKRAGDFRMSDISGAIVRRENQIRDAKAAQEAEENAGIEAAAERLREADAARVAEIQRQERKAREAQAGENITPESK